MSKIQDTLPESQTDQSILTAALAQAEEAQINLSVSTPFDEPSEVGTVMALTAIAKELAALRAHRVADYAARLRLLQLTEKLRGEEKAPF